MAAKEYPVILYVYVTKEQADTIHSLTTNVSAWVRNKIDHEAKCQQRRQLAQSEAKK